MCTEFNSLQKLPAAFYHIHSGLNISSVLSSSLVLTNLLHYIIHFLYLLPRAVVKYYLGFF